MNDFLYASVVLFSLGFVLRTSLRLLYGVRGPQAGDVVFQMVHTASWALTILPVLVFLVASTLWLSVFLIAIVLFAGLEFVLARREMQRRAVWLLLRTDVDAAPVEPVDLQLHANRFTGRVGRGFRRVISSLQEGKSLPITLSKNRTAVPMEALAQATLDTFIATSSATEVDRRRVDHQAVDALLSTTGQQIYQRLTYLGMVLVIMLGIVSFLAIQIIPSYEMIFSDFGLELPPLTIALIGSFSLLTDTIAASLMSVGFATFFLVLLLAGVLYLADIPVLRPVTDRLFFAKHRAQVLRLLATAAERGIAFEAALSDLASGVPGYASGYVRKQLRKSHAAMIAGLNWKDAIRRSGFIRPNEYALLDSAQLAGNLPWALRLLAAQKVRAMVYRWAAIEQIVFPILVVCVGVLVMFICVGLFMPLVELINGLTG